MNELLPTQYPCWAVGGVAQAVPAASRAPEFVKTRGSVLLTPTQFFGALPMMVAVTCSDFSGVFSPRQLPSGQGGGFGGGRRCAAEVAFATALGQGRAQLGPN